MSSKKYFICVYMHAYTCIHAHICIYLLGWGRVHSSHLHLKGNHYLKLVKNLYTRRWSTVPSVIKSIQIKTTRKYHYMSRGMAVIKKTSNTEYWCGAVSYKVKDKLTIWLSNFTLGNLPKRE